MNATEWNKLVAQHAPPFGAFLQSFEWGEFQERLGFKLERVHEVVQGKTLIAQAFKYPLPFKLSYWYLPKAPLGDLDSEVAIEFLRQRLLGGAFLELEPTTKPRVGSQAKDRQPSVTTIIDLTQSEVEINENMKAKTRYNIRLAEKKGVTASIVGLEHFDDFSSLMRQTAARGKFSLHELDRYKLMLETLNSEGCRAFMAMAFYQGLPLAASIMIDAFGTRTYLHGASSNTERNLMAPYALHDWLIRDAKSQGLVAYDFWGIAPPEAGENHPWAGISRFKLGFGGAIVRMPGTFDIGKNSLMFSVYRLAKKIHR